MAAPLFFLIVSMISSTHAALPDSALRLLKTFPGQKITLPLVVTKAMKSSDSFRAVKASELSIYASELERFATLETSVYTRYQRDNNRNQPIGFGTSRLEQGTFALGVQSGLRTGGILGLELSENSYEAEFNFPGMSSFVSKYSTMSLQYSQPLWRNFLGWNTRALLESGTKLREAGTLAYRDGVENWVVQLVNLYYRAWGMQAQVIAAQSGLERRERLKEIIRIRARRGTAERPDLLQVQGALIQSELSLASAEQSLNEIWRNLVTSLKLPTEWLELDPTEIPMEAEAGISEAQKSCEKDFGKNTIPKKSTITEKARLQAEAAHLAAQQAIDQLKPDLSLKGSLINNAVLSDSTDDLSARWRDTFTARNPYWQVGVELRIPLDRYAQKAQAAVAVSERDRLEAIRDQEAALLRVNWLNACSDLNRWVQAVRSLKSSLISQRERQGLEEQRYRQGRIQALNVIQAGDDLTNTELSLREAEVQLRLKTWDVRRMSGLIPATVQKWAEKL